jgi:hypothetical protein
MSVNTVTTSNQLNTPETPDGYQVGSAATSKVGFYGATPVVQPTSSSQAIVTDSSGGTAAATNGIQTITATYNSTILANAVATLAQQSNALRLALVNLGLIKGS